VQLEYSPHALTFGVHGVNLGSAFRLTQNKRRKMRLGQLCTWAHHHKEQSRLKCIDEGGSFLFHSGVFSIDDPSHMDSWKIKVLMSMIDYEENPEKKLLILEGGLKSNIKYYHGCISHPNEPQSNNNEDEGNGAGNGSSRRWEREICRSKSISIIHENADAWIKFYEAKCGIKYEDLNLSHFQEKAVKTEFVLFLLQVDMIPTVYVKERPPEIEGSMHIGTNNSDVLKSAAQKYQSICQNFLRKNHKFKMNKDLTSVLATTRPADRVRLYITDWMDLEMKTNNHRIPSISFNKKSLERSVLPFWEDILFNALRYLNDDLSTLDFTKILNHNRHNI
jgi:hypothetical protein